MSAPHCRDGAAQPPRGEVVCHLLKKVVTELFVAGHEVVDECELSRAEECLPNEAGGCQIRKVGPEVDDWHTAVGRRWVLLFPFTAGDIHVFIVVFAPW